MCYCRWSHGSDYTGENEKIGKDRLIDRRIGHVSYIGNRRTGMQIGRPLYDTQIGTDGCTQIVS